MSFWQVLGGVALAIGAAAVVLAVVSYQSIIRWFKERIALIRSNPHNVGVSVVQHLQNGNFQFIQGVFDTNHEQWNDARVIETQGIDPELINAHDANGVAVWTI